MMGDNKFEKLKNDVVGMMQKLSAIKVVFTREEATKLWTDFEYDLLQSAEKSPDEFLRLYVVKQPLNVLKLAMCYAASRLNIDMRTGDELIPDQLFIDEEDMQRAIEDIKKHIKMSQEVIKQWGKAVNKRQEDRVKSSKLDVDELLEKTEIRGGLTTVGISQADMHVKYQPSIVQLLDLAVKKGKMTQECVSGEQGNLTEEEYKKFKPKAGRSPAVYRLTKKGEQSI